MSSQIRRQNDGEAFFRTPKPIRKPGLRQANPERAKEQQEYSVKRRVFLGNNQHCDFAGCKQFSFDVHHKAGRNGDRLLDETDWMAICRKHHKWVHDFPNAARELGYLV